MLECGDVDSTTEQQYVWSSRMRCVTDGDGAMMRYEGHTSDSSSVAGEGRFECDYS